MKQPHRRRQRCGAAADNSACRAGSRWTARAISTWPIPATVVCSIHSAVRAVDGDGLFGQRRIGQGGSWRTVFAQTAAGLCFPRGSHPIRATIFTWPTPAIIACSNTISARAIRCRHAGRYERGPRVRARREWTNFTSDACDINGGIASNVGMCNPLSVAVDGVGNVYVGDDGDHRVLEFDQRWRRHLATGVGDVVHRYSARDPAAPITRISSVITA